MTQNQIAYHNAKENERHNKAYEAETRRHALVEEALKARSNELTQQANEITKSHYERQDAINAEHYTRSDTLNELLGSETMRSNLENESIRRQQNAINAAGVAEQVRHQKTMESIESSLAANTIKKTQADVSYTSANTGYIQQQTMTEKFRPQLILNQATLAGNQASTESYRPAEVVSKTIGNAASATNDLIQSAAKLFVLLK